MKKNVRKMAVARRKKGTNDIELFTIRVEHEAPLRKVNKGVERTIKDYIDDLILLGKE